MFRDTKIFISENSNSHRNDALKLTTATIPVWAYFSRTSEGFSLMQMIVSGKPVSSQNLIISSSSFTGS